MKKGILVMAMMLLYVGTLFANGQKEEEKIMVAHPKAGEVNEYGWEIPAQTIDLEYYYKRQVNPDKDAAYNEKMHNYLLEEFNINIVKIVYDTNPEERFNLMLASNKYPVVLTRMTKSDVIKLNNLGKLQDMSPYIAKYTNIKKELGELYPRYVEENGEVLGLPYGWRLLEIPDYSAHIRYDIYTDMGSPKIETPYEYYDVLKQMIEKNPTNETGEKVYALSWNSRDTMGTNISTLAGIWGLKDGYKTDKYNNLTHWINTPEGKEFTAFYNQVHRDGLLDPDAFTNKFEDWRVKFSNKRIIGHIGGWWQSWNAGHEVWQKTDENWTEEQRFMQIAIKDSKADKAYLSPKDTTGWGYTVITDKEKNPEEIVRVLDFMMTPNGTRLMAWGVPNQAESNWNIESDGSWSFVEKAKSEIINATYDYEAHRYFGDNQYWLVHPQGSMSDDPTVNAWIDQCFNDTAKWKKLLNENMKGTAYDNSAMSQVVFLPNDPILVKKQQVEDTIESLWPLTVLSNTPEEFEKNYNNMVKKLKKAGVDELQDYMEEGYKANLAKWSL